MRGEVFHVVGAGRKSGDAGARECDLGCGREFINQVRIAGSLAFGKDLDQVVLSVVIDIL